MMTVSASPEGKQTPHIRPPTAQHAPTRRVVAGGVKPLAQAQSC